MEYPESVFAFRGPLTLLEWNKFSRTDFKNFIEDKIRLTSEAKDQLDAGTMKDIHNKLYNFYERLADPKANNSLKEYTEVNGKLIALLSIPFSCSVMLYSPFRRFGNRA